MMQQSTVQTRSQQHKAGRILFAAPGGVLRPIFDLFCCFVVIILHFSCLADASQSQITTVRTVDDLADAVATGKEFIHVVAHLDLREGRSSRDFALNKIRLSTRAIRGDCDTPPSDKMMAEFNFTKPLEVKRGQCVLVSSTALLTGDGSDLLFDNFAIPLVPNNSGKELSSPILLFFNSDVYLSSITVHGSDVEQCAGSACVIYAEETSVAAQGCAFVQFRPGGIVDVGPGSAVSLQNSDFTGSLQDKAPLIKIFTQACTGTSFINSFLWISDNVFENQTNIIAIKGIGSQYQLYVDDVDAFNVCEFEVEDSCSEKCLPGQMKHVRDIPEDNPFYTSSDELLISKLQDWNRAMSHSGLAPGPKAAAISPPSSSEKSGVHTVAFQGAMSALGVMTLLLLCFLFRVCGKKRSWECLVQRVKDGRQRLRQEQRRGALQRANVEAVDDVTVQWELQNDDEQHVPNQPDSAVGAESESDSGDIGIEQDVPDNVSNQPEQAHECKMSPSVTPSSPQTPTARGQHRRPPAPHARRLSPRHPHREVLPRHQRLHGTRAGRTAGHTRSAELPHRASTSQASCQPRTEESAHSQNLPSDASTGNCPLRFSAGRDPELDDERHAVQVMTAPVLRAYNNAGDIGGSGDSNPEQTLKNFSADDPSTAVKFDEVLRSIKDGDTFLGRYVLNFTDRLDLGRAREEGMLGVSCYNKKGLREEKLCLMIFNGWIFFDKQMRAWRPSDKRLHAIIQGFVCASDPHKAKKESLNDIDIPFWMIVKAPDSLAEKAWNPGLDKLTAIEVACQACEQLSQLHALGYVNCDPTPDSICMDNAADAKVRAGLFSLGVMREIGQEGTVLRPRTTSAPELICAYSGSGLIKADPAQDVYAMGVIFGEILTGVPFPCWGKESLSFDQVCQLARDGERMQWQGQLNPDVVHGLGKLKDIILRAVHPEPSQRPSAKTLVQYLRTLARDGKLSEELKRTLNVHTATTESHEPQDQSATNTSAASTSRAAYSPSVSVALPRHSSEGRARAPPQEDQQITHREASESSARIRTAAELLALLKKVRAEQSVIAVRKPATVTTSVTGTSNEGCAVNSAPEDQQIMHSTMSTRTARAGHAAPSPRATGRSLQDQPADDEYQLLHLGTKKEGRRGSRAQTREHAVVQHGSCSNVVAVAAQVHDSEMSSTCTDTHGRPQHTNGSASSASASQSCTAGTRQSSDAPYATDSSTMQAIQPSSAAWYSRSPAGGSFLSSVGSVQPSPARKMITAAYRFANSLLSGSRDAAHPLRSTDVISPPVSQVRANDRSILNVLGSSS